MPIYEYRCSSCGVQKDVMQKISDAVLTTCPECGKETFSKQLSVAGFQLKGSGYYATDFKDKPPASKCETAPCAGCPVAGGSA
jgi:putative FmdB family regulatory protein